METLHILQKMEFQILAAAVGITDLYGIRLGESLSEKTLMYGIHEMVRKKILIDKESSFEISEPYRSAFLSLKDTKWIFAAAGSGTEMENTCFYLGEKLVTIEESLQDKNAVRMGVYEKEALYVLLQEKGFLPKPYLDLDIAVLQPQEELLEALSEDTRKGLFEPEEFFLYSWEEESRQEILAQYLVFAFGKDVEPVPRKALYLLSNPCNYWIAEKDREQTTLLQYDENNLYERILDALEWRKL